MAKIGTGSVLELRPREQRLIVGIDMIDPRDVLDQPDMPVSELAAGFNARAYRAGDFVLKVSRRSYLQYQALQQAQKMQAEYELLRKHHDSSHIAPTTIWVANRPETERNHVVIAQPFIAGATLAEFNQDPGADKAELASFLQDATDMYAAEGSIADLANIQTGFNPTRQDNLRIRPNSSPTLIDTTYGTLQRSELFGPLINAGINWGVEHYQQRIQAS